MSCVGKPGIFVTFEGGDGAGKSTQTELLAAGIQSDAGREVVRTFQPGDTPVGQKIRQLVLHGDNLAPRAEALLFAADRAHHVAAVVRPALERGAVVLCDRYIDSRSEEHTSELQSRGHLVCRLRLERKKHTVHPMTPE